MPQGLAANTCEYKPAKIRVVQGVVLGLGTKEPLPHASVEIRSKEQQERVIAQQTADAEGRFQFSEIPFGKYWLRVSSNGFNTFWIEIHVSRFRPKENGIAVTLAPKTGMGCFDTYVVRPLQIWERLGSS
jgi:hypothetical protein